MATRSSAIALGRPEGTPTASARAAGGTPRPRARAPVGTVPLVRSRKGRSKRRRKRQLKARLPNVTARKVPPTTPQRPSQGAKATVRTTFMIAIITELAEARPGWPAPIAIVVPTPVVMLTK